MKSLIYKELKLAMHPICYVFVFFFPLLVIIPSYPVAIGFIYVLSAYPILFLGANKGQQSNDLLFTALLPVRKRDIVLARITTVFLLHSIFILISSALVPVGLLIKENILAQGGTVEDVGIGLEGFVGVVAIVLVGYSIADLIFFPIYYKRGKSIVMSTLLMIFAFAFYLAFFSVIIPYMDGGEAYVNFLTKSEIWVKLLVLLGAIVIYIGAHILVYILSYKRLEKVDF